MRVRERMTWVPRRDLRSRLYTESQQIQEAAVVWEGLQNHSCSFSELVNRPGLGGVQARRTAGYRHLRGVASPQHSDRLLCEVFSVSAALFSDTQYRLASVGRCHLGWGVRGTSRLCCCSVIKSCPTLCDPRD